MAPVFLTALCVEAMMLRLDDGYASTYYGGLNLCILAFAITVTLSLRETAVVSFAIVGMWIIGALIDHKPIEFGPFFNNLFFMLGTVSVAVGSTLVRNKVAAREYESFAANVRLKELDEAKSRFFANASHELRTPLVSLSSTVQMIAEEGLKNKRQHQLITASQHALQDMLENVNDILLKTRAEQGRLEARWSEIDVGAFVARSLSLFMPLAEKRGLTLTLHDHLPAGMRAYVDRRHLKKIINNLVGNALKFTERGHITVTLERAAPHWRLQVEDSGKGIPAEDLPHVFDPFVQASNNLQRDVQGTGLGLSLVKDLVGLHQGQVYADSRLGAGSRFIVLLPLGKAHVDFSRLDSIEIDPDEETRINLQLKSMGALDLSEFEVHHKGRPRLLVVEDNPQVLQVLAHVLREGYNLSFARNGEEGIERIRALQPDLVISDVMMPKKNGYALAKEMKDDPMLRRIPLILLTSKADTESRIEGFEHGADEYIAKPFDNREVRTRVRGLLERRKIETEAIHAEKLVSIGKLAAGLAHEINNPASCITGTAPLLRKALGRIKAGSMSLDQAYDMMCEGIDDVHESGKRITALTASIKGFVHPGAGTFASYDLQREIAKTLSILRAGNPHSGVHFHTDFQLTQKVECNATHLNQVWMNLLQNALDALEEQEEREVTIRCWSSEGYAFVSVADNGPGIPGEDQGQIFDLFFTTKALGKGTGMGLYLCRKIVDDHRGAIRVESSPGQGARFVVQLPLRQTKSVGEVQILRPETSQRMSAGVQYPHKPGTPPAS
ncbi:MAG: ATP-binding protein [Polyangiales bacterium]